MTSEEFVEIIRERALNSAVTSLEQNLAKPPGRSPAKNLVELSEWYNKMVDSDKSMLKKAIEQAARYGIFGFLAILDGERPFKGNDEGQLKLYFESENQKILLNDGTLHEMI